MGNRLSRWVACCLWTALIFPGRVAGQQAGPAPTAAQQAGQAPTDSDIYCAGFFTHRRLEPGLHVLGNELGEFKSEFADRDLLYLSKGSGWIVNPGGQYMVVRPAKDFNPRESFPGQLKLLSGLGTLYAEIARVEVRIVHEGSATAEVLKSCEPIMAGDFLIPLAVRPAPPYRAARMDPSAPASGKAGGVIVTSKEFQQVVGTGNVVYLNLGKNQGAQVGGYLRVFRTYLSGDQDPLRQAARNYSSELMGVPLGRKLTRRERASMPRTVLGEIMLLSVEDDSSTGIVTFSGDAIFLGDEVEGE